MVGWRAPSGPGDLAFDRVAHDRVFQERDLAVEHADIDLGGLAGLQAMDEGCVQPRRRCRGPRQCRRSTCRRVPARHALRAGDAHDAAHALDHHVVGGVARVGAGMAEARGRGVDQLRVLGVELLPAVTQLLHRAGTEVLDDDIGLGEQLVENGAVRFGLEVEGDALLAAIDRGEVGRLPLDERSVGPRVVAALGGFDLDHPGAHLGHQERAVRPRQDARQVDDGDARQGAFGALGHGGVLNQWAGANPATRLPLRNR